MAVPDRVKKFERRFLFLYLISDYLAIMAAFVLAYAIRAKADVVASLDLIEVPVLSFSWAEYLSLLPWVAALWLFILILSNHYNQVHRRAGLEEFFSLFLSTSMGLLALMILGFFIGRQLFSRLIMLYAWAGSTVLIFAFRIVVHQIQQALWRRQIGVHRVLVCGVGKSSRQFLEGIRQQGWPGYYIAGILGATDKLEQERQRQLESGPILGDDPNQIAGVPYLGAYSSLTDKIHALDVDQIVIALEAFDRPTTIELIREAHSSQAKITLIPDMLALTTAYKVTETINGVPIMGQHVSPLRGVRAILKRIIDILFSLLALLLLSPLLGFIALAVRFSSPGPIIYHQPRIGRHNRTFQTYKFRTMRAMAENKENRYWTTENDSRRTGIGEFLRKNNLDELPQLWNILKGDMSLVGPRPEQPQFVEQFGELIPGYNERHRILPGLTGWAQVNGWRGNTSIEERLRYDLFYVENWSLLFDFRIMCQTLRNFTNAKGAY